MISKDGNDGEKMIAVRRWKSQPAGNPVTEATSRDKGRPAFVVSSSEQERKAAQDKPGVNGNSKAEFLAETTQDGWGLNILRQKPHRQQQRLESYSSLPAPVPRGSFVDLIGDDLLSKLTLRDEEEEVSSTSRSTTSGASLVSSTSRQVLPYGSYGSGRPSSRTPSSVGSSGESSDIDAYFDQDLEEVSDGQQRVARASYKRGLSQRRIRGSSSSEATKEENEKTTQPEETPCFKKDAAPQTVHQYQDQRQQQEQKEEQYQQQQEQDREQQVRRESFEELFYAVKTKDEATVRSLHSRRVSLESADKNGITPLIVSCLDGSLLEMARLLMDLGANIHTYRPGLHAGYPLHHAAKRGHDQIVGLLLSRGASALAVNDDGQTALDMARIRGHASVVRVIEDWISLFRGILRQVTDNAGSQLMKRIWAVVLPSEANSGGVPRHELVIYNSRKVPMPESVILLGSVTSEFDEPDFSLADPSFIITDKVTKTKFKFFSHEHGDKQQLSEFYAGCKGIQQRKNLAKASSQTKAKVLLPQATAPRPSLARSRPEKPGSRRNMIFPEESLRTEEGRQGECVICKQAAAVAVTGCGHACSSALCLSKLRNGLCPRCRARGGDT